MPHDPAIHSDENKNPGRLWNGAVITLVFAGVVAIVSRTYADNDLWGHLTYGLDTLKNGAILR